MMCDYKRENFVFLIIVGHGESIDIKVVKFSLGRRQLCFYFKR